MPGTRARPLAGPSTGLVPGIYVFVAFKKKNVDGRDKPGHDEIVRESVMASLQQRTEIRDGMRIDWDVPVTMDDGLVLRADVFRPVKEGQSPVILSYGPYAKSPPSGR